MLTNKVAIVTGASRGIGSAIAKKLAENGARVIINYCGSEEKARAVRDEINSTRPDGATNSAEIYQCNISDPTEAKKMIEDIYQEYGQIDVLVNNAGITRDGLLIGMSEEDFEGVIDTNLKGAFSCMKTDARYMLKKKSGSIINISSVSGVIGNPGQVNYSASKAGLIGMTKSAAKELATRNIRVNAIAPGFIESDMTDQLPDSVIEGARNIIAMKRFGKPEEIAGVAAFLASDASSYVTGQVIRVDGGM